MLKENKPPVEAWDKLSDILAQSLHQSQQPPGEFCWWFALRGLVVVLQQVRSQSAPREGLAGINFQDAYLSRGEVSSEAPSPLQAADAVSRLQLRAHGLAGGSSCAPDAPGT